MRPYIAQIVYRIDCDGLFTDQYEQQSRLVFASDETEALAEARAAGKHNEKSLVDRQGRHISWYMLAVKDLQPADLKTSAQILSGMREPELVPVTLRAK